MKPGLIILTSLLLAACNGSSSQDPKTPPAITGSCKADDIPQFRIRFKTSPVPGVECESEKQRSSCVDGTLTWDGSFTEEQCRVTLAKACGSTAHDKTAVRTRYREAVVPFGSACEAEEQTATCNDGNLSPYSGSFTFTSCIVQDPKACGSTPHDSFVSRTRYQSAEVPFGESCRSEEQKSFCNNGTMGAFDGTFTFENCAPKAPVSCGSVPSGSRSEQKFYKTNLVEFGKSCEDVSRIFQPLCTNGGLENLDRGEYIYSSCQVAEPKACGETPHGQRYPKKFYKQREVVRGDCESITKEARCNNGTLEPFQGDEAYRYESCAIVDCISGANFERTRYKSTTTEWPATCESVSQKGLCTAGKVEWTAVAGYPADACVAGLPKDCGEVKHGSLGSRTRYKRASVPFGGSCSDIAETQSATCSNGEFSRWSGAATAESCVTEAPAHCPGEGLLHGQQISKMFYEKANVAWNGSCEGKLQTGTCENGKMVWQGSLIHTQCKKAEPLACGALGHGQTTKRTYFESSSVAWNEHCKSEERDAVCENGTLKNTSGSFSFESCKASQPLACAGGVGHLETLVEKGFSSMRAAWNESCSDKAVTREALCTNGELGPWDYNGSFHGFCWKDEPLDCRSAGLKHSESRTVSGYSAERVEWNQTCADAAISVKETCENGSVLTPIDRSKIFSKCTVKTPLDCGNVRHGQATHRYRYLKAQAGSFESCSNRTIRQEQTSQCLNGQLQDWSGDEDFAFDACSEQLSANAVKSFEMYNAEFDIGGGQLLLCTLSKSGVVTCASRKAGAVDLPQPPVTGKVMVLKEVKMPGIKTMQLASPGQDFGNLLLMKSLLCALTEHGLVSCWSYVNKDLIGPFVLRSQRLAGSVIDFAIVRDAICLAHAEGPAECYSSEERSKVVATFSGKSVRAFVSDDFEICGKEDQTLHCSSNYNVTSIESAEAFVLTPGSPLCFTKGRNLSCGTKTVEMPRPATRLLVKVGTVIAVDASNRAFAAYNIRDLKPEPEVFGSDSDYDSMDKHILDIQNESAPDDFGLGSTTCLLRVDGDLRCDISTVVSGVIDAPFKGIRMARYQKTFPAPGIAKPCLLSSGGLVECFSNFNGLNSYQTGGYLTNFRYPRDIWIPDSSELHEQSCVLKQDSTVSCMKKGKEWFPVIPGLAESFVQGLDVCSSYDVPVKNSKGEIYCLNDAAVATKVFSPGESLRANNCSLTSDGKLECSETAMEPFPSNIRFKSFKNNYSDYWALDTDNRLYGRSGRRAVDKLQTNGYFEVTRQGTAACFITPGANVNCASFGLDGTIYKYPSLNGATGLLFTGLGDRVCALVNGQVVCTSFTSGERTRP